jgi:hypothetical protein
MDLLVRAAVRTLGKMCFVIATHLGGDAGNVISPARQDLSNDRVNAFIHKFTNVETPAPGCLTLSLKLNSFRGRILRRQHHPVTNQSHLRSQRIFRRPQSYFRMVILFRQVRQYYV